MCGFVFVANSKLSKEVLHEQLTVSTQRLKHRGPDAEGIEAWDGMGFGFRRLSIIDVSPLGNQPMCNDDGSIWIVMNGEIYNYIELRAELIKKGYRFKSQCDTEVLLYAYQEYGVRVLNMLRGMFAFVIWDNKKQELLMARDRYGEKPLYWSQRNGALYVASEMKAIFNYPEINFSWDANAIDAYLNLGYIPAPMSMYKGIRKLPPATYMIFRKEYEGHFVLDSETKYWDLCVDANNYSITYEDAKEQAFELLMESVRLQLRSDVPLGAFLSGGVDSSTIVAVMRQCGLTNIKAFSIGFEESDFNELPYAELVAKHLGVEHYTEVITQSSAMEIDKIFDFYDEPFADSSAIPTYFVSKLAREHVTVSLSGDGGDELFAGYVQYKALRKYGVIDALPSIVRKTISSLGAVIIPESMRGGMYVRRLGINKNYRLLSLISNNILSTMLTSEFNNFLKRNTAFGDWRVSYESCPTVSNGQKIDQRFYLADDILTKVDRSSMAVGLESRVPLLDYKFAEFINSLPIEFKISNDVQKVILKDMMSKYLPTDVLYRKKQGFAVPLKSWLCGPMQGFVRDELNNAKRIFKMDQVDHLIRQMKTSQWDLSGQVWKLLSLGHWFNK